MLLWIDSPKNDPAAEDEIVKSHPTLEIKFISTYKDAAVYLYQQMRDIEAREKFIVICRGTYHNESKGFLDVVQLFETLNLGTIPIGVYTGSRENLLKKVPNPPERVVIFDRKSGLLAFLNGHLNK
jgi:hypothetical protein